MKLYTLLLTLCFASVLTAQEKHFTYISDQSFKSPDQLIGYNFQPSERMIPNREDPDNSEIINLQPGDISFGVTRNYLYVKGGKHEGAYSINSINSVNFGFKLDLMNARNPAIQGHLKIILNNKDQVDALVFKPSGKVDEMIYYQAYLPEALGKKEKKYFTDKNETQITDSTLWGAKIYPFFDLGEQQYRIREKDNLYIHFIEDSIKTRKEMKAVHRVELNFIDKAFVGNENTKSIFQVDKIIEREEKAGRDVNHRFILEFSVTNSKVKKIYVFLNEDRMVNNIRIDGSNYLMRGVNR